MWLGEQSMEVGGANIHATNGGRVASSRASGEGAASSAYAAFSASKASWK